MAFDGLVMKNVINEMKTEIIDSKVNKIFSPTKNDILFNLYNCGKTYNLLINLSAENCRICISNSQKKNPISPSNFCMLLRKHLTSSRIVEINTFGLERIAEIVFECYADSEGITYKKIYAEIMNRYSNIILTDEKNKIIGSLKYTEKSVYSLPESSKIDLLEINSFDEFFKTIHFSEEKGLTTKISSLFVGISKPLIFHILEANEIDNEHYSDTEVQIIFNTLKQILNCSTEHICINEFKYAKHNDYSLEFCENNRPLGTPTINQFVDKFYYEKENAENFANEKYRLEKLVNNHLKKCKKKLENIDNKLKDCDNMDIYRIYGELLNSNLYRISNLRSNSVELENYYENNNLIKIPLDISIPVKKNAEKYFKKYRKLKNASQIVSSQKEEAEKDLAYLESILFAISISNNLDELSEISLEINDTLASKSQKKNKKIKKNQNKKTPTDFNIEKIDINGFTIYIGKNNRQNEFLTLKFASRNDIWFHVQGVSGSHVVLKTNNLELTDEIIYKCASLAKKYSKAENSLNVSIDYTTVKNIKKSPSGKPGMVIYNTFKTVIV